MKTLLAKTLNINTEEEFLFRIVDYYDKLSNLLDAIRALNHVTYELQGRD